MVEDIIVVGENPVGEPIIAHVLHKPMIARLGRGGRSSSRTLTVQFRVQFLDASGTIIREMHADAWNAAAATALVKGSRRRSVRTAVADQGRGRSLVFECDLKVELGLRRAKLRCIRRRITTGAPPRRPRR